MLIAIILILVLFIVYKLATKSMFHKCPECGKYVRIDEYGLTRVGDDVYFKCPYCHKLHKP